MCSLISTALECAVVFVQGLLDLVLEISVDLSSTLTSISVDLSVKGHASLSKLATAMLTGLSSQLHSKNESGMNGLDSLPITIGDGVRSSLSVCESALLINTALNSFKCRHSTSSSVGVNVNEDVHGGSDADFNNTVSLPHTSILCNTTTAPPLHPAVLHTEQRTHSTKSPLDDTPHHPSLHLPISVRLGAVGHACYQAAVTALSILSSPSPYEAPSFSTSTSLSRAHLMSSKYDASIVALEDLLLLVFDAYRTVGSIGVEDSLLKEAADAAELLLRGHEDLRRGICSRSAENDGEDLGSRRCRQIPDSQHSLYPSNDSIPGASYRTVASHNSTRSNRGLSSYSTSSSFASRDGDRAGSYSGSAGVGGGNSVGVGVPLTSGNMGWSDDSSSPDASENDTGYLDDIMTSTRTVAPSKSRVHPSDLIALAVQNLPQGVKGSIERYDMHCQASDVYVTEFDGATTGAHMWP